MRVKWYGTASLLVEGGGTRILIDPYLRGFNRKLPSFPLEETKEADAILITHPHLDHFSDVGAFTEGVKQIYVSANGILCARENGIPDGKMTPLSANEKIRIGEITVRTFRSRHCKFDAATILRVAFSPRTYLHLGSCLRLLGMTRKYRITEKDIFALELSCEGKRVMILGSAGMEENVVYPEGADLLVFPYQGRAQMHRYMIPFLHVFRPKAVMIDHFDDAFPPLTRTTDTRKFEPTLKRVLPEARALVPEENVWYEV